MFFHREEARYVRDYVVWLRFNDGTSGEVDLKAELHGEVFAPPRDKSFFKQFALAYHTVSWSKGADFVPELLKERVHEFSPLEQG